MKLYSIFFILLSTKLFSFSIIEVCSQCKYQSIQKAINEAQPFDTLHIKKGIYYENSILLGKPLTIQGDENTIIDASEEGYVFIIETDNFSISGLHLTGIGFSHTKDYAAILISNSKEFLIENNILEQVFFGILLEKSSSGIIRNNIISGEGKKEFYSGNGIHLWHCKNITITNNEVFAVRDGIYLEFTDNSLAAFNNSHNNIRYGLHFMFSNNNSYKKNTFSNNGAGVAVMFSKNIKMIDNIFELNWGSSSYGLLLKEIYDAEIIGNRFLKNTIAINVDGSSRINYLLNTFEQNGWALKVTGGCYSNQFRNNNFISNSFGVSFDSKLNDNLFINNYWNDYTGYDLDKDGLGDIEYRPVKLFSFIINKYPESIILMRSLFIDIINFSEKVTPIFTPDLLVDSQPLMRKYDTDRKY